VINESDSGWALEPENANLLSKSMKMAYLSERSELKLKSENDFNYAMNHLSKKII
tara:strand:- start:1177 stop:1341 length:165 start_codon:yes stop_codon:yes gene_type:complete